MIYPHQRQFHKQASQQAVDSTTLPRMGSSEESIPQAVVPYNRDDDRARYLGLRASGFTIREALGLLGKAKSTVSMWRRDSTFLTLENSLPELRKTLALEYASLEFLRNYRLILEKDFRVIKSSLHRETYVGEDNKVRTVPQDSQDYQYLLKARAHYTPQQLQAIEQLFGAGDTEDKPFDWTDFVMTLSRTKEEGKTKEEVKIEAHTPGTLTHQTPAIGTRHRQESQLGTISGEE